METMQMPRQLQPGATILVAEDDPGLLKALAMCLSFAGHRVLSTSSADEALEQCKRGRQTVDVLLTDLHFRRGMSGADLVAETRRQNPALKVICLAGAAIDLLGANRREQNCLPKPFSLSSLKAMLGRVLAEKQN